MNQRVSIPKRTAEKSLIDERVRGELLQISPRATASGSRQKMAAQQIGKRRSEPVQNTQAEEDSEICQDESAGGPGEGWKTQRDGAGAGHCVLRVYFITVQGYRVTASAQA